VRGEVLTKRIIYFPQLYYHTRMVTSDNVAGSPRESETLVVGVFVDKLLVLMSDHPRRYGRQRCPVWTASRSRAPSFAGASQCGEPGRCPPPPELVLGHVGFGVLDGESGDETRTCGPWTESRTTETEPSRPRVASDAFPASPLPSVTVPALFSSYVSRGDTSASGFLCVGNSVSWR
jgi:hypothetical protein